MTPTQTTTYTLTATSPDGHSVTAPVTVTVATGHDSAGGGVHGQPAPPSAPGQSSQLCWQVTNATSISITGRRQQSGRPTTAQSVSPATTTTYTLTATNASGQIQANVTLNVGSVQIISFTSSPDFSSSGQPITLSWQTQNATSVVITGNGVPPQTLPANGTLTVAPVRNHHFHADRLWTGRADGKRQHQRGGPVTGGGSTQGSRFRARPARNRDQNPPGRYVNRY